MTTLDATPIPLPAYDRGLPAEGRTAFPLSPLDDAGEPVHSATLWLDDGPPRHGTGYGATPAAALTNAWSEVAEGVCAREAMARLPRVSGSYEALARDRGPSAVLDPLEACLGAGDPYTPAHPLAWVEGRRLATGEPVLVPVEMAAASPDDLEPGPWLVPPTTNGLGAGPTVEAALAHGLLDLVGRDGSSVTSRALDEGVGVHLDAVADPETRALLDRLDADGYALKVKLASTDLGMANLRVVGHDRDLHRPLSPIMVTACGEAVHPDRERALADALRDFLSSRVRKAFAHGTWDDVAQVAPPEYLHHAHAYAVAAGLEGEEQHALAAMVEWLALDHEALYGRVRDPVLGVRSSVAFSSLPTVPAATAGEPAHVVRLVIDRLVGAGLDPLWVDLSPPGHELHAVRVVVPGLEVETMVSGRIGVRNLRRLLERGSDLVGVGAPPAGARPIRLTKRGEDEVGGRAWLDSAALTRAVGGLYPLYREPGRHAMALARGGPP